MTEQETAVPVTIQTSHLNSRFIRRPANLLVEKGIITQQEFMAKLSAKRSLQKFFAVAGRVGENQHFNLNKRGVTSMRKLRIGLVVVFSVFWAGAVWSAQMARVPETGQTTSFAAGDDGALQRGVTSPRYRFTDTEKGTIKDRMTGLIWLKNANCLIDRPTWQAALDAVAELNTSGTMNGQDCGDTSGQIGSHRTDWRLPNIKELLSLMDYGQIPALPVDHPFSNFQPFYWSSTTSATDSGFAWIVNFFNGFVGDNLKTNDFPFVTAVRGP